MSVRFAGKVALCTGSGRRAGLGAAILQALAAEGCKVVFTDMLDPQAELTSANIASRNEMQGLVG